MCHECPRGLLTGGSDHDLMALSEAAWIAMCVTESEVHLEDVVS